MLRGNKLLKKKFVTFGVTLPYIWAIAYVVLNLISYAYNKINTIIAAEYIIPLTFILSPFIFCTGAVISLSSLLKSGKNKDMFVAFIFNILMLVLWFIFRNPFYIELNFVS